MQCKQRFSRTSFGGSGKMRDLKNLVSMVVVRYRLFNTFSSKAVKVNYFIYNYVLLSTCYFVINELLLGVDHFTIHVFEIHISICQNML